MTRNLLLLTILLIPFLAAAQLKTYKTSKLSGPVPVIDGKFEDEAWSKANWCNETFTQFEPFEGQPASQTTSYAIVYDDNNLYVAIRANDSTPEKINKRLLKRDNDASDWVGIAIDSYEDKLTSFIFNVTAAGTKIDAIITNDNSSDESWDPIWYVKTKVDALGWTAEMRIPFSQLRFTKKQNYQWGLEVGRYIFRKKELSFWQPLHKSSSRIVSDFGILDGIANIKPKKDIELFPFALAQLTKAEKEEGNPFKTGSELKGSAGIDGKISITNDFTLNMTINPDFGQVEADPSEVNLTAFESYFSEKRPFFIEGRNIFNFPLTSGDGDQSRIGMFYSRRLGRAPHFSPDLNDNQYAKVPEKTSILGAFKLSGKTHKGTSIGILESFTPKENAIIDTEGNREKYPVEPFTNYVVARVEQDFNKGNTVAGGLFTATNRSLKNENFNTLPKSAYTGGANYTKYWKDKTYMLGIRGLFSSVNGSKEAITELQTSATHNYQRTDATHVKVDSSLTSLKGFGGTVEFGKIGGGHLSTLSWITFKSPGLDFNDIGFMPQADEIQQISWFGYREWNPKYFYRSFNINGVFFTGWNFEGLNLYKGINMEGNVTLKNYFSIFSGIERHGTGISTNDLRGGPAERTTGRWQYHLGMESDDRKKLVMEIFYLNVTSDHNHFLMHMINYSMTYKPMNTLSISLMPEYTWSDDNLQYVDQFANSKGTQYLMSNLVSHSLSLSTRINLSLTPDLSIQYYAQPFYFAGKYSDFKLITNSMSKTYEDQFRTFDSHESSFNTEENEYTFDTDFDGQQDYTLSNPDFHFLQYRSNLVLRWEYKPGSAFYLVWAQGRTNDGSEGRFNFNDYTNELYRTKPQNDFLIKVSYAVIF